jgi:hypothetical protein
MLFRISLILCAALALYLSVRFKGKPIKAVALFAVFVYLAAVLYFLTSDPLPGDPATG